MPSWVSKGEGALEGRKRSDLSLTFPAVLFYFTGKATTYIRTVVTIVSVPVMITPLPTGTI